MSGASFAAAVALVPAALALSGCPGRPLPREVPAVLTRPTPEAREELARVVSQAVGGAPVTLADDALTADSTLIVDLRTRRDARGRPLQGRRTERPERFRLVKSDSRCVLIHESSERRWTLDSASCAAR